MHGRMAALGWLPLALFGLMAYASPTPAAACTCVAGTANQNMRAAYAVFAGEAVGVADAARNPGAQSPSPSGQVVLGIPTDKAWTFAVDRVLKGPDRSVAVVLSAPDEAACGTTFELGRSYVVHAHEDFGGALHTGLCSGNYEFLPVASRGDGKLIPPLGNPSPDGREVLGVLTVSAVFAAGTLLIGARR